MATDASFRQTLSFIGLMRLFFSGMLMGVCDLVPGISGSSMAHLLGHYGALIEAISQLRLRETKYLRFLGILGLGLITSVLLFVNIVHFMLSEPTYRSWLMAFFTGLTLVCAAHAFMRSRGASSWALGGALFGFLLMQMTSVFPAINGPSLWLIPCGFLAGSALLMPAVSGSMILCLLGVYPAFIEKLALFTQTFSYESFLFLFLLAIGVGFGFFVSSRLIRLLLHRHEDRLNSFFSGFIALSLPVLWPFDDLSFESRELSLALLCFTAGIVVAVLLAYYSNKKYRLEM